MTNDEWCLETVAVREVGQKKKEREIKQQPLLCELKKKNWSHCSADLFLPNHSVWLSHLYWNYLAGPTLSHMDEHYSQRTHSLQQQQYALGGGETHVHRMRPHPGYRRWYWRQHWSTLSSLFSPFRPSGYNEVQTVTGRNKKTRVTQRHDSLHMDKEICLIHSTKSTG